MAAPYRLLSPVRSGYAIKTHTKTAGHAQQAHPVFIIANRLVMRQGSPFVIHTEMIA